MKPINFIKTLTPAQQHALISWYHLSIALTGLLCISLALCQSIQLYTYLRLKKDASYWMSKQATLHQIIHKKNELLQKIDVVEKTFCTLKTASSDNRLPQLLDMYVKSLNKTVLLQSLTLNNTHALCIITCNKSVNALKYVEKLANSGLFASVKLTQLKTHNHQQIPMVQATIKAELLNA